MISINPLTVLGSVLDTGERAEVTDNFTAEYYITDNYVKAYLQSLFALKADYVTICIDIAAQSDIYKICFYTDTDTVTTMELGEDYQIQTNQNSAGIYKAMMQQLVCGALDAVKMYTNA